MLTLVSAKTKLSFLNLDYGVSQARGSWQITDRSYDYLGAVSITVLELIPAALFSPSSLRVF